jgi:hypothetical protein
MVNRFYSWLAFWLITSFISTLISHAQTYELKVIPSANLETEFPFGMVSKPLPTQKKHPLFFWGVRADTLHQHPPVGLQIFGFDATSPKSDVERDSMLAFVYQQVFDTVASYYTWFSIENGSLTNSGHYHVTDTLWIDGEAYRGLVVTGFYAPRQWVWVWYSTASHIDFLQEASLHAWEKLNFLPQFVIDAQQRLTFSMPHSWVAFKGKNEDIKLVPRTQINQNVLSEKIGYHTVEGYVYRTDSLLFEDMRVSL